MTTDPHDGPTTHVGRRNLQSADAPFFASYTPGTAGFLRGLAEAAAGGVITAVIAYLEVGANVPAELIAFVPVLIVVLRTAEGLIDSHSQE